MRRCSEFVVCVLLGSSSSATATATVSLCVGKHQSSSALADSLRSRGVLINSSAIARSGGCRSFSTSRSVLQLSKNDTTTPHAPVIAFSDELLRLVHETRALITASRHDSVRLTSLYESLSVVTKRAAVKPYKTLFNALKAAQDHFCATDRNWPTYGVELTQDGLSVRLTNGEGVFSLPCEPSSRSIPIGGNQRSVSQTAAPSRGTFAAAPTSEMQPTSLSIRTSTAPNCIMGLVAAEVLADRDLFSNAVKAPMDPLFFPYSLNLVKSALREIPKFATGGGAHAQDFFFSTPLEHIPEPCEPIAAALPKIESTHGDSDTSLKVSSFTQFIPTFFVPVTDVVTAMPAGYTEEHIETYLRTAKTVQLVTVGGTRFVRIFGGYGQIDLDGSHHHAATIFGAYKPDPSVLPAWIAAFDSITDRWMPLPILMQRADPEAVKRLPFVDQQAILYFAQMQHVFAFNPDGDGSVLLRPPRYSGLLPDSSPVPWALSKVLELVPFEGFIPFKDLDSLLSPDVRNEILAYFPSFEYFLRSHSGVFYLGTDAELSDGSRSPAASGSDDLQVCRSRYKSRLDRKQLPLEEQIELAIRSGNKKLVRGLRRKLALIHHSDSPYTDRAFLAKEVHAALPKRHHIRLKFFLRDRLPEDILNFMPRNYQKLFSGFPELFQIFEHRTAGNWCVMRAGLQLPSGVLRKDYTDDDILLVLSELLSRGARSVSSLLLHLPEGVSKALRVRHGDLYAFSAKYPQYFSIVEPIEKGNVRSAAVIHLIQMPQQAAADASRPFAEGESEEDADDDVDDGDYFGNSDEQDDGDAVRR